MKQTEQASAWRQAASEMGTIKPPALKKGDTIGIISPCYATTPELLEKSVETLREMGYSVKLAEHLFSDANEYAGSVEERAADFNAMAADSTVRMILFGGGEVGNEILPYIDYANLRKDPKILCSYSDGTSILNAVTSQTGLVTFYGASPRTFGEGNAYNLRSFSARICSDSTDHEKSGAWQVITPGACEGILTGGYLINYAALFATPYFSPPEEDYILLIEDHQVFSEPAVVSKWFSNLEMYGAFERAKGLIFGHYSNEAYPAIDQILHRIGTRYQIPVVRCDDFGHGTYNAVFPLGILCRMDTKTVAFTFLESGVKMEP